METHSFTMDTNRRILVSESYGKETPEETFQKMDLIDFVTCDHVGLNDWGGLMPQRKKQGPQIELGSFWCQCNIRRIVQRRRCTVITADASKCATHNIPEMEIGTLQLVEHCSSTSDWGKFRQWILMKKEPHSMVTFYDMRIDFLGRTNLTLSSVKYHPMKRPCKRHKHYLCFKDHLNSRLNERVFDMRFPYSRLQKLASLNLIEHGNYKEVTQAFKEVLVLFFNVSESSHEFYDKLEYLDQSNLFRLIAVAAKLSKQNLVLYFTFTILVSVFLETLDPEVVTKPFGFFFKCKKDKDEYKREMCYVFFWVASMLNYKFKIEQDDLWPGPIFEKLVGSLEDELEDRKPYIYSWESLMFSIPNAPKIVDERRFISDFDRLRINRLKFGLAFSLCYACGKKPQDYQDGMKPEDHDESCLLNHPRANELALNTCRIWFKIREESLCNFFERLYERTITCTEWDLSEKLARQGFYAPEIGTIECAFCFFKMPGHCFDVGVKLHQERNNCPLFAYDGLANCRLCHNNGYGKKCSKCEEFYCLDCLAQLPPEAKCPIGDCKADLKFNHLFKNRMVIEHETLSVTDDETLSVAGSNDYLYCK